MKYNNQLLLVIIVLLSFIVFINGKIPSNVINGGGFDSSGGGDNDDLINLINNILYNGTSNQELNGTTWGIKIDSYSPITGEFTNLYSLNELKYFTPASCTKLFTTVTIFYTFGEDFKVFTPFFTDQPLNTHEKIDSLDYVCVKASGDPSMTMDQLSEAVQFFTESTNSIKKVILDTSFYNILGLTGDGNIPQAWEWEDLTSTYGALPTPLILNENTMNIYITPSTTVGNKPSISFKYSGEEIYLNVINQATTTSSSSNEPTNLSYSFKFASSSIYILGNIDLNDQVQVIQVPILDPEQYFLTVFPTLLKENGVQVGESLIGSCNYTGMDYKSFMISSPSLSEMLNYTLLTSNNLYAETFLRQMGTFNSIDSSNPLIATYESGLQYIQSVLGIPTELYYQVDGSGLSRNNLITPTSLISVIESVYTNVGDPEHDYISYLPVSGVSGTLSNRFKNTIAEGIVSAKTGSMSGVNSLTGLLKARNQNQQNSLFFSIIANNSPSDKDDEIINIIDEIIILLAKFNNNNNNN